MSHRAADQDRHPAPRPATLRATFMGCLVLGAVINWAAALDRPSELLPGGASSASIANLTADLIAAAIPRTYTRRDDWGRTKEIAVGLRWEWEKRRLRVHRRKKEVPHGVWKHYRVDLEKPEALDVQVDNLRSLRAGRIGFTLRCRSELAGWIRVKTYHYGLHLGAFEVLGTADVGFDVDLEVGVGLAGSGASIELDPLVVAARLRIHEIDIDRVSDADGPLVRELGKGLRSTINAALNDEALKEKLNRAIDKKRDSLTLSLSELLP